MKKSRRRSHREGQLAASTASSASGASTASTASTASGASPTLGSPASAASGSPASGASAASPASATEARSRRRWHHQPEPPTAAEPEPEAPPATSPLSGQLPPGEARAAGAVATEAGRYLLRAARDEAPARFGSPDGEIDESARRVWEIAFGLVVRRRFEADAALAEISRTVAAAVHEHAVAGLPLLDAEMLVRAALGESVPTGDIDGGVLLGVHLLLFASLADELALGDAELTAIIAEAEEKAATFVAA
ncbi:hypothetical protein ACQP2F_41900 [Actinoplanes sp. CA-030573]|uniref:hypothetical protein n=1 Tax=Actinoplanes sp. CA-030573 TaxID=3239898 RepID=UPI003D8CAD59